MDLDKFARKKFYGSLSLEKAEEIQNKMGSKIKELKEYKSKIPKRENLQKIILDNGRKLFKGREMIIEAFRKHISRFFDETEDSESDSEFDDSEFDGSKFDGSDLDGSEFQSKNLAKT